MREEERNRIEKPEKKKRKRQEPKKQRRKEKKKFVPRHREGKRNRNGGHHLLPAATWNYHLSATSTTNVTARLEVSLPSSPPLPPPHSSSSYSFSFSIVLHVNSGEYLNYLLGQTSSGRDQND